MHPRGRNKSKPFAKFRDAQAEARLFAYRALTASILVLLGLLTLVGRLAWLQVIEYEHFATLSDNNRIKLQPITPTRGRIFDRNGVLLADNLASLRLEITPEEVENMDATLEGIRDFVEISDADIDRFRKLVRRTPAHQGIPLRFQLSEMEIARLAVNLHRFPGVEIKADLSRYYPLGETGVHVIGYVGRIDEQELQSIDPGQYSGSSHIGKTGVEKSYEDTLRGRVGYQQVETNAEGRMLRVLQHTPPTPGKNIYLTIDIRLQQVAEAALEGYTGAIVAIDPRNGEVLALASEPGYDSNLFVNGIDPAAYEALDKSPDRPLFNRALRGTYPPGSTLKPFIGLAGLETGVVNANRSVYCPGYFRIPGVSHKFRDWKRGGHGHTELRKAIVQSCDVYFYDLAYDLGIERLHDFLDHFNLGRLTGIDLNGEKPGLVPSPKWKRRVYKKPWYAGETVIAGIGQGYMLVTPLQLAHATAILAQRGHAFRPRLLYATQEQGDTKIQRESPHPLPPVPVHDPSDWDRIINAMTEVVHGASGTARRIGLDASYKIAGKTGTAQVFSLGQDQKYNAKELAKNLRDHALFIAFAPVEAPRIAVAVIAEHGGGGSANAAPMARKILDAWLVDLQ